MAGRLAQSWRVLAFTLAYLMLAIGGAVVQGNFEFILYIAVMLGMICAVLVVDRQVRFSQGVLWGLSVWGLAHMAGGLVHVPASWPTNEGQQVLYSLWLAPGVLKYDNIVHGYGFGVMMLVCWEGLAAALRRRGVEAEPTGGLLLLCGAAALGFGALNEVVEFVATLLLPSTNVGGYRNTGWDLVANLVGVLIVTGLIVWRRRGKV